MASPPPPPSKRRRLNMDSQVVPAVGSHHSEPSKLPPSVPPLLSPAEAEELTALYKRIQRNQATHDDDESTMDSTYITETTNSRPGKHSEARVKSLLRLRWISIQWRVAWDALSDLEGSLKHFEDIPQFLKEDVTDADVMATIHYLSDDHNTRKCHWEFKLYEGYFFPPRSTIPSKTDLTVQVILIKKAEFSISSKLSSALLPPLLAIDLQMQNDLMADRRKIAAVPLKSYSSKMKGDTITWSLDHSITMNFGALLDEELKAFPMQLDKTIDVLPSFRLAPFRCIPSAHLIENKASREQEYVTEAKQYIALLASLSLHERLLLRNLANNPTKDSNKAFEVTEDLRVFCFTLCGPSCAVYVMEPRTQRVEAGKPLYYDMMILEEFDLKEPGFGIARLTRWVSVITKFSATVHLQGLRKDVKTILGVQHTARLVPAINGYKTKVFVYDDVTRSPPTIKAVEIASLRERQEYSLSQGRIVMPE